MFSPDEKSGIKPVLYTIILLFTVVSLKAQQNLVPNPSFEEYIECPTSPDAVGNNQLEKCKYWYKPNAATSDYYNSCQADHNTGVSIPDNWFGNQYPFDGNAYVGLILSIPQNPNSEYIQCKLISPLEACKKYLFSMRVSLGDYSSRATNTLGVRFDTSPIAQIVSIEFNGFELPTHIKNDDYIIDTNNWILFSGEFLAKGGEEYLTIGRFIDTSQYSNLNIPLINIDCDSCFSEHNTAYYYIDSITLVLTGEDVMNQKLPNVLTANNDKINDYWYPYNICISTWECTILNRWGSEIFMFNESDYGWDGRDNKGNQVTEGVYYYLIRYFIDSKEYKMTGFIQLVR